MDKADFVSFTLLALSLVFLVKALQALFTEHEANSREQYNHLLAKFPKRKSTVGKHEARNYAHLENVLKEADKTCPKAADTIRWLLWHEILDAQWHMHMAEMLKGQDDE